MKSEFSSLTEIFNKQQGVKKIKPPAYEWQSLALKIIADLVVPNFKRSSIFKVCRENSKITVERALNDTKELCKSGEKWRYFLKIITNY